MFTFHLHMLEQPCIEGFVPLALCEDHIYAVESLDILYLASVKLADDLINDANEQKDKVEYVNQRLIIEAIAINNPTLQSAILAVFDSASGTERYIQEKISEL